MAAEAREEGFEEIADKFEMVAKIEKEHEERYRRLLGNIKRVWYSPAKAIRFGSAETADIFM
jgi:rubrerythrin